MDRARRREDAADRRRDDVDEIRSLKRRVREEAAVEAETEARTYVVESGDSLSKIAKELLGDAGRWPEIFDANKDKIEDPNLIYPGQELDIPS
jgi:nucleoid-associated protein YgaU